MGQEAQDGTPAVYATTTGSTRAASIVAGSDALLGYESGEPRPPQDLAVHFVDFPFTKDELGFEDHLKAVRRESPRLAVAPDVEGDRELGEAIEMGDRLLEAGADDVVIVPKSVHPSDVPDRFRVGVPLANYGSDAPHQWEEYADAGEIHLLGGVPQLQLEVGRYLDNVASVDGASVFRGAEMGNVWAPTRNRNWHPTGPDQLGYYGRLEASLDNIVEAWRARAEDRPGDYEVPEDPELWADAQDDPEVRRADQDEAYRRHGTRGARPAADPDTRDLWDPDERDELNLEWIDFAERRDRLEQEALEELRDDLEQATLGDVATDGGEPADEADDGDLEAPRMYWVKGPQGPQDWLDGQDVLVSAGVAWMNPGEGFNTNVPDADRLFVDSGGYQAAVHFREEYPYSPEELLEWAEEIGADYVAGMDWACEDAQTLAGLYDDVEPDEIAPVEDRLERTIHDQVRQLEAYQSGDYSFEIVPVVQGQETDQYRYCSRRLRQEGLAREYMGIGTVCKRASADGILEVLDVCEEELPATDWHLFGATKEVWTDRRFWGRFRSADTHAWAMKTPEGDWTQNDEDKIRAFNAYKEDIEAQREAMASQSTFSADASSRALASSLVAVGARQCVCGTCIPAYSHDFEPGCRHCEMTKINRFDAALADVEAAHRDMTDDEENDPYDPTEEWTDDRGGGGGLAEFGVDPDEGDRESQEFADAQRDGYLRTGDSDPVENEREGLGEFGARTADTKGLEQFEKDAETDGGRSAHSVAADAIEAAAEAIRDSGDRLEGSVDETHRVGWVAASKVNEQSPLTGADYDTAEDVYAEALEDVVLEAEQTGYGAADALGERAGQLRWEIGLRDEPPGEDAETDGGVEPYDPTEDLSDDAASEFSEFELENLAKHAAADDLTGVLRQADLTGPTLRGRFEDTVGESVHDFVAHYEEHGDFEAVKGIGPATSESLEIAVPIVKDALEESDAGDWPEELGEWERDVLEDDLVVYYADGIEVEYRPDELDGVAWREVDNQKWELPVSSPVSVREWLEDTDPDYIHRSMDVETETSGPAIDVYDPLEDVGAVLLDRGDGDDSDDSGLTAPDAPEEVGDWRLNDRDKVDGGWRIHYLSDEDVDAMIEPKPDEFSDYHVRIRSEDGEGRAHNIGGTVGKVAVQMGTEYLERTSPEEALEDAGLEDDDGGDDRPMVRHWLPDPAGDYDLIKQDPREVRYEREMKEDAVEVVKAEKRASGEWVATSYTRRGDETNHLHRIGTFDTSSETVEALMDRVGFDRDAARSEGDREAGTSDDADDEGQESADDTEADSAASGASAGERVTFGTLEQANEWRDEHEDALAPSDDRRTKEVTLHDDVGDDVLEDAETEALKSKGDEGKRYGQETLTDAERDRLEDLDGWSWGTHGFHAQAVKGIAVAEGVDDWIAYYDHTLEPGEHVGTIQDAREMAAETGAESPGSSAADRDVEPTVGEIATEVEKAESEGCEHARDAVEDGANGEAEKFLLEECDYSEDELEELRQRVEALGEDPDAALSVYDPTDDTDDVEPVKDFEEWARDVAPEPPDRPSDEELAQIAPTGTSDPAALEELPGPALNALRKAWSGYKLARADQREAREQAEHYAEVINGIRAVNGQDPMTFEELEGFAGGSPMPEDPTEEFPTDDGEKSIEEAADEGRVSAAVQSSLANFADPYDPTGEF